MSNVQSYKSQAYMHGAVMPLLPGAGSLQYDKSIYTPTVTGNYSKQNSAEGFRVPVISLGYALLDGSAAKCPIDYTNMAVWFARSNDAIHDLTGLATPGFFNGADGFTFPYAKPNTFTLRGSRGGPLMFEATYMCYVPSGDSVTPVNAAFASYTAFGGKPIMFEDCEFYTGSSYTTCLEGLTSFTLQYSNNITPDMSYDCTVDNHPVNVNAGVPTASFQLGFNSKVGASDFVSRGNKLKVVIASGSVAVALRCPNLQPGDGDNRNNAAPRTLSNYSGECLGIDNTSTGMCVFSAAT